MVGMGQALTLVRRSILRQFCGRVDNVLRTRGRGVAIFKNQQHCVVGIEQRTLNTC